MPDTNYLLKRPLQLTYLTDEENYWLLILLLCEEAAYFFIITVGDTVVMVNDLTDISLIIY